MKDKKMVKTFLERIKLESSYRKLLNEDVIEQIISIFTTKTYEKQIYPKRINNCFELALNFYKSYNYNYYKMIIDGLDTKKIIISDSIKKPYVDTSTNVAYFNTNTNQDDGDLFIIVHELAHFIDRNSEPQIIPDKFWFLSEVFSLYMEKRLETWLTDEKYEELISVRKNNRMYYEADMLKAIRDELYYEKLYIQNSCINEAEISIDKIKNIMKYNYTNLVNYLLSYPIGNILSDYLINTNPPKYDNQICDYCLKVSWYEILPFFKQSILQYKSQVK